MFNLPIKPRCILLTSYLQPCFAFCSCICSSHPTVSHFSLWNSPGRHVWSAWEAFSHLPCSGAEVTPKDHALTGTKFSSLICANVFITFLINPKHGVNPLTTVKGITFKWLCKVPKYCVSKEKSTFKLILNSVIYQV